MYNGIRSSIPNSNYIVIIKFFTGSIQSVKQKAMLNMFIILRDVLIALNVIRNSNVEEILSSISKQFISNVKLLFASFVMEDFPRTAACTLT